MINLLQLLPSDDQATFMDKANYNFDQLLSENGGPRGYTGPQGPQGIPGQQGVIGLTGPSGAPGSAWTVTNTAPTIGSPEPNNGDFWFDTSTLIVWEFVSGSWVSQGTLIISGDLYIPAGQQQVVFATHHTSRSLVLSSIDYGGIDSNIGAYQLKLVGQAGGPIMVFGTDTVTDGESDPSTQAIIEMDSAAHSLAGDLYDWKLINPTGQIMFMTGSGDDNYVAIRNDRQITEFNGAFKINMSDISGGNEILLSYSDAVSSGRQIHIGTHNDDATAATKFFTVDDAGMVGINTTGGSLQYTLDVLNPTTLTTGAGDSNLWTRLNAEYYAGSTQSINVIQFRNYIPGVASSQASTELRFQNNYGGTDTHFISFHGGGGGGGATPTTGLDGQFFPSLRLGYATGSVRDGYRFAMDKNGKIFIGNPTFINTYNDQTHNDFGGTTRTADLNIRSTTAATTATTNAGGATMEGAGAFNGIHLYLPGTGSAGSGGITFGGGSAFTPAAVTQGGIIFTGARTLAGSYADASILTSYTSSGGLRRILVDRYGITHFWARQRADATGYTTTTPGTDNLSVDVSAASARLYAYNNAGAMPILLGQVGTPFGVPQNAFLGADSYIGIGGQTTFVNAPQTKLHIDGEVTIGTRDDSTVAGANAGQDSLSHGTGNLVSGAYSVVLSGTNANMAGNNSTSIGGIGHHVTGNNSVAIGYGYGPITLPTSNVVAIGAPVSIMLNGGTPSFNTPATGYTAMNGYSLSIQLANGGVRGPFGGIQIDASLNSSAPAIAITNGAQTNFIIVGNKIGVNTEVPTANLHVSGTVRMMANTVLAITHQLNANNQNTNQPLYTATTDILLNINIYLGDAPPGSGYVNAGGWSTMYFYVDGQTIQTIRLSSSTFTQTNGGFMPLVIPVPMGSVLSYTSATSGAFTPSDNVYCDIILTKLGL